MKKYIFKQFIKFCMRNTNLPLVLINNKRDIKYYNKAFLNVQDVSSTLQLNINDLLKKNDELEKYEELTKDISIDFDLNEKVHVKFNHNNEFYEMYIFKFDSIDYSVLFFTKDDIIQYKLFFNFCNDIFCISSRTNFLQVNNAFCKLTGFSKKELYEKPYQSFVNDKDIEHTDNQMLDTVYQDGYLVLDFYNRLKVKDCDESRLIQWKGYSKGERVYAIGKDVTNIKEYERLLLEKNILLNECEVIGDLGYIIYNIKTKKFYTTDNFKKIYNLQNDIEQNIVYHINETIANKNSYEFIIEKTIDLNVKIFKFITKYIKEGDGDDDEFVICICKDITVEKNIENNLINDKELALKHSKLKSEFLANISHEIRTPLNGITGMISLLASTNMDSDQQEYFNIIKDSSGILLSLINNILNFSKIEANEIHINNDIINISTILTIIEEYYKMNLGNKDIRFIKEIDPDILQSSFISDQELLNQILLNLINNSVKFTNNGHIKLTIKLQNDNLIFDIEDTGIGIRKELLDKLFIPFTQGDNSSTKTYKGTGLGLTICDNLIKLLSGKIYIQSKENEGTKIGFSIPYKIYKNPLIVIVEDNDANLFYIYKLVNKRGYSNIRKYKNGLEAYNNIIKFDEQPDLILMDLHMPLMDGYTCTEKLREDGIQSPIIAVTANVMNGVYERCIKCKFNDVLFKPINESVLFEKINNYI